MSRSRPNRQWTDAEMLEVLHMRDHRGMTAKEIADNLGVTKNAIIGLWHRVAKATDGAWDGAGDNGTGNGSMPDDWWRRA